MRAFLCIRADGHLSRFDMAAEIHQSVARRAAILRIIGESTVRNQDELVKVLRKEGFEATQSSVSRDLRELRVAKAGDRYILPSQDAAAIANPFVAVAKFVTEIKTAGSSLTVVKTTTGTAQSVAVAIDSSEWPEIVGTISGDDTIFIATDEAKDQKKLRERLRGIFGL
jgi:transcriptional regulator of arginine metabolism